MVASWSVDRLGDDWEDGADVLFRCGSAGKMSSSTEGSADYSTRESDVESTASSDNDTECRTPARTFSSPQDTDGFTPWPQSPAAVIEAFTAVDCSFEEAAVKPLTRPCVLKQLCVPVKGNVNERSRLDQFFIDEMFHELSECEDGGDYATPRELYVTPRELYHATQADLDRARVEAGLLLFDFCTPRGITSRPECTEPSPDDSCASSRSGRWQGLWTRCLSRIGDTGFALASTMEYRALGKVGMETREEAIYHSLKRIVPAVLKISFRVGELAWRDAAAGLKNRGGLQRVVWDVGNEISSAARTRLAPHVESAVTTLRVRAARARQWYADDAARTRVQAIRARRFAMRGDDPLEVQTIPRRSILREMGRTWFRYCQFVAHNAVLPAAKQYVQVLENFFEVPASDQLAKEEESAPAKRQ